MRLSDQRGQETLQAIFAVAFILIPVRPARAAWHEPITVTITSTRHIGIPFLFSRDVDLVSSFTARGEVNH